MKVMAIIGMILFGAAFAYISVSLASMVLYEYKGNYEYPWRYINAGIAMLVLLGYGFALSLIVFIKLRKK
jgi:hypothetical protein